MSRNLMAEIFLLIARRFLFSTSSPGPQPYFEPDREQQPCIQ